MNICAFYSTYCILLVNINLAVIRASDKIGNETKSTIFSKENKLKRRIVSLNPNTNCEKGNIIGKKHSISINKTKIRHIQLYPNDAVNNAFDSPSSSGCAVNHSEILSVEAVRPSKAVYLPNKYKVVASDITYNAKSTHFANFDVSNSIENPEKCSDVGVTRNINSSKGVSDDSSNEHSIVNPDLLINKLFEYRYIRIKMKNYNDLVQRKIQFDLLDISQISNIHDSILILLHEELTSKVLLKGDYSMFLQDMKVDIHSTETLQPCVIEMNATQIFRLTQAMHQLHSNLTTCINYQYVYSNTHYNIIQVIYNFVHLILSISSILPELKIHLSFVNYSRQLYDFVLFLSLEHQENENIYDIYVPNINILNAFISIYKSIVLKRDQNKLYLDIIQNTNRLKILQDIKSEFKRNISEIQETLRTCITKFTICIFDEDVTVVLNDTRTKMMNILMCVFPILLQNNKSYSQILAKRRCQYIMENLKLGAEHLNGYLDCLMVYLKFYTAILFFQNTFTFFYRFNVRIKDVERCFEQSYNILISIVINNQPRIHHIIILRQLKVLEYQCNLGCHHKNLLTILEKTCSSIKNASGIYIDGCFKPDGSFLTI